MKKILVAEDIKDINNLVCDIMEGEGYEVSQANDGEQAIKLLETAGRFDLIVLDIIMPHQDGFDVIKYMADNKIRTPVLGMSGGGRTISGEVTLKSVKDRVDEIIKKPFTKDDFLSAVKRALAA